MLGRRSDVNVKTIWELLTEVQNIQGKHTNDRYKIDRVYEEVKTLHNRVTNAEEERKKEKNNSTISDLPDALSKCERETTHVDPKRWTWRLGRTNTKPSL